MTAARDTPLWLRWQGWTGRGIGFLCGAIGVLGFAPLHIWPLGILSFALLFSRLTFVSQSDPRFKAGLSTAFWHGLGFFGAGIFWVGSAFIARGPAFIPIMPPMVLGLAALLALFWALAGGFFVKRRRSGFAAILVFTAMMMMAELARGHVFGGFPWNLPGYIFEAGSRPSQIASLVNIYGLSWIVLFVSAGLGLLLSSGKRSLATSASVMILPLACLFIFGQFRLASAKVETVPNVNLRLVSVPFSQADKLDPNKSIAIVNDFITASVAPGIEEITHLIWPEGAINELAMENPALLGAMGRELAVFDDAPPVWIINSARREMRTNPRNGEAVQDFYNSMVMVTFDGQGVPTIAGYNDKYRLVPFGEFIPGGKWLESLNIPLFSTALASFSRPAEKTLTDIPGLPRTSSLICYESDFPGLTPIDKAAPAQVILNQTNDAWYGKTWGPAQHANIARYRTIEEGIPMVRVASNGLTAVIDPYGRVHNNYAKGTHDYIDSPLPRALNPSNRTQLGILINFLLNILIILIFRIQLT